MTNPPSAPTLELQATAGQLFVWAHSAFSATNVQVWVADDLGLHPRAFAVNPGDAADRVLARQCCVQGHALVQGHTLAIPLALTDRCSGACLFTLTTLPDLQSAGLFQARVDGVAYRLDTAIQLQRVERLTGVARQSHFLRNTLAIAHALEDCDRLAPGFALLHESLQGQVMVDNFFVALLDESGENLVFEYYVDNYEDDQSPISMHEGLLQGSLTAFVVSAGRMLRGSTRELLEQSGHIDEADSYGYGTDSYDWLGVPLMVGDRAIGALVVQSYEPDRKFNDIDPTTLTMVAEAMAAALTRRRVRETLQRSVQERTAQLEQANQALQETVGTLERAKLELVQAEKLASLGSMVAGISHELNTPIGNALTISSTLEESFAGMAAQMSQGGLTRSAMHAFLASGQEMCGLLVQSSRRAADLITSFKQVAVDQTSAQRRVFDVQQVIGSILIAAGPSKEHPGILIHNTVAPGLQCDSYPGPLGQLVANLIQNAILHGFGGRPSGNVHIRAELRAQRVLLIVEDDGVGMTAQVQARVFDPFFTTRLGQGGSGLGLAVCHRLATSVLGGDLSVVSTVGKGTTFVLEFPASAPNKL